MLEVLMRDQTRPALKKNSPSPEECDPGFFEEPSAA